ncbi:MAG: CYTH domain-containing protein [Bacteroidota bacterium]
MKNLEIERKFLVDKNKWASAGRPPGILYIQGYLSIDQEKIIRVRVAGNTGFITVKGKSEILIRSEYEYVIPVEEARDLLKMFTRNQIEKTRYRVPVGNFIFEVDEFHGMNKGLFLAEVELSSPADVFEKPQWLGKEVTENIQYYNAYLSENPFIFWGEQESLVNKNP